MIPRCAAWRTDSVRMPRLFRDMRTSLWWVWWKWCCRAACCPECLCVPVVYRRDRSFTSDLRNICKYRAIGICDVSDILKRDEQFLSKQINSHEMLFSITFPFRLSYPYSRWHFKTAGKMSYAVYIYAFIILRAFFISLSLPVSFIWFSWLSLNRLLKEFLVLICSGLPTFFRRKCLIWIGVDKNTIYGYYVRLSAEGIAKDVKTLLFPMNLVLTF